MDRLNHPGKFFFLVIERWTCKNFHFLRKTIEKLIFLHFLKYHNYKINDFSLVFQQKWNGTKIRKSNFTQKLIEKYDFYIFCNHKNPKIIIFQWFFIKNESGHAKKSWLIIFICIQAKNEKNHDFWRGLIFPFLSSPRPDSDQNFAISHVPAGKNSHRSDINIPFLDQDKNSYLQASFQLHIKIVHLSLPSIRCD